MILYFFWFYNGPSFVQQTPNCSLNEGSAPPRCVPVCVWVKHSFPLCKISLGLVICRPSYICKISAILPKFKDRWWSPYATSAGVFHRGGKMGFTVDSDIARLNKIVLHMEIWEEKVEGSMHKQYQSAGRNNASKPFWPRTIFSLLVPCKALYK